MQEWSSSDSVGHDAMGDVALCSLPNYASMHHLEIYQSLRLIAELSHKLCFTLDSYITSLSSHGTIAMGPWCLAALRSSRGYFT